MQEYQKKAQDKYRGKFKQFSILLTPEEAQALKNKATAAGVSKALLIKRFIKTK